jgi:hypothetical protein
MGGKVSSEFFAYVDHETLISNRRFQMGTEYLLRREGSQSHLLYSSFQGERYHKQIQLCLTDPFWIANTRPASREVILKPTCIIVTLRVLQKMFFN